MWYTGTGAHADSAEKLPEHLKEIPAFASRFLLTSAVLHPDKVPDSEDEHAVIPPESSARNGPRSLLYVAEYSTSSRISKLRSLESSSRCTPG